jgi:hypothetical protein
MASVPLLKGDEAGGKQDGSMAPNLTRIYLQTSRQGPKFLWPGSYRWARAYYKP